jgi:hypothetical protein
VRSATSDVIVTGGGRRPLVWFDIPPTSELAHPFPDAPPVLDEMDDAAHFGDAHRTIARAGDGSSLARST